MRTAEEKTLTGDFDVQYQRHQSPVWQAIEREACGCDYGGTSWTTRDEADWICELLGLHSSQRLLEVGAGAGWPGLYLARKMGCDVALLDLPFEGLRIAAQRAADEKLDSYCWIAVADGTALPLEKEAFDAISHSDVLCCLDAKLEVLQDCRRVIHPGGTMIFTVISIAPNLSSQAHARAIELGPPYVDTPYDYPTLLSQSDWRISERVDLTREYALTARRYVKELEAHRKGLEELLGKNELDAYLTRMRGKIVAIEEGLFLRELYVSVPQASV